MVWFKMCVHILYPQLTAFHLCWCLKLHIYRKTDKTHTTTTTTSKKEKKTLCRMNFHRYGEMHRNCIVTNDSYVMNAIVKNGTIFEYFMSNHIKIMLVNNLNDHCCALWGDSLKFLINSKGSAFRITLETIS